MDKTSVQVADEADYAVTLYGCSSLLADERVRLAKVFSEVLEAVLGTPEQVVDLQYAYNRILKKFTEMSLPLEATVVDVEVIDRWTSAYQAAFDAAFVAVFGNLHFTPEEAHFEIEI